MKLKVVGIKIKMHVTISSHFSKAYQKSLQKEQSTQLIQL
jgi:hypothetical protein